MIDFDQPPELLIDFDAALKRPKPSTWRVAAEAPAKAVNMLGDEILNTPTRLANLALAGVGSIANATGHPGLAPDTLPDPNFIRRNVGEGTKPEGALQENLDKTLQFATMGATSPNRALQQLMTGGKGMTMEAAKAVLSGAAQPAAMAGVSGSAGDVVGRATGSPLAELIANILTPLGLYGGGRVAQAVGTKGANLAATVGASRGNEAGINRLTKNAVLSAAGDNAPFIQNAARNATEYVPGAKPTIGEAIAEANMGQPSQRGSAVVKLQKDLTGAKGIEDILPSVTRAQDVAMLEPIQRMAGGATSQAQNSARAAAEKTRTDAAVTNYGVSDQALLPGRIMGTKTVTEQYAPDTSGNIPGKTGTRPVTTAGNGEPPFIAGMDGRPKPNPNFVPDRVTDQPVSIPGVDETIPGRTGYRAVRTDTPHYIDPAFSALMERPSMEAAFKRATRISQEKGIPLFDESGNLTGKGAHLIKIGLDDEIGTALKQATVGRAEKDSITQTKGALLSYLENKVPAYRTARTEHARLSEPINKLQVGQALANKLQNESGDLTPSQLMDILGRGEGAMLKTSTGSPRELTLEGILGPDDFAHVQGAGQNLGRRAEMNRMASSVKGGQSLESLGGEPHQLPNLLSREAALVNYLLRGVVGDANVPVARRLAAATADPEDFASLLIPRKPPLMMKDAANSAYQIAPISALLGMQ